MDLIDGFLLFLWLMYFWETYLSRRQRKIYENEKVVPKELSSIIDNETFEKSRKYALDKNVFGFWNQLYSQIENTFILKLGGYPFLWMLAGKILTYFNFDASYEIIQSLVFVTLGQIFGIITGMPWSLYSTFVLEERHGFNKMTLSFYFKDLIKKTIVSMLISLPLMALIIYIIKAGGEYFYLYAWGTVFVFSIVLLHVYPEYIAPLFDRYDPLPDGELKESIEELARSLDYPLKKLYVVDGSKRSAHSNAYMYGFHKNKRIVLFDTLLEDYSPVGRKEQSAADDTKNNGDKTDDGEDKKANKEKKIGCNTAEVVAVLGHELGHWKFSHMLKNLAIVQVKILVSFFAFGKLMNYHNIFAIFGFPDQQPILIRLIIVFSFIFSPFNEIEELLMNVLSRRFEFQADEFAIDLGKKEHLKSALLKLHKDNLSFPIADWMFSARHYSHPPLLERLRAMDRYKMKSE